MNEGHKRFAELVKIFKGQVETVDGHTYYAFDDDVNHAAFREQLEEEFGDISDLPMIVVPPKDEQS